MAAFTIFKLKNLTPLHIGTGKENYDFSASDLHSDTLTASLAAIRSQHGKVDDVEAFLSSFLLSSALPFWHKSFFLPKVQGKINVEVRGKEIYEYRKKLKKIKYIESSLWEELILGKELIVEDSQIQSEYLLSDASDFTLISKTQVNERASVPREGDQKTEPFFFEWKYFNEDCGLFCLTDASGALLQEITDLFRELGEVGIGTDRNVGGGKFEVESSTLTIDYPQDSNAKLLLSLYLPTEEELPYLNIDSSKYELLLRGGYISGSQYEEIRHLLKKSVYMFNCGSVFKTTHDLKGKIINLRPQWNDEKMHPVYRSGKPFCIPIKYNEL